MVPTPNTAVHRAPIMISDVVCDRLDVHLRQCAHRPVSAGHGCRDTGSDSQKVSLQCTYDENTTNMAPDVYPAGPSDPDGGGGDGGGLNLAAGVAAGIACVVIGLVYGYYRWTRSNSAPISAYTEVENDIDDDFNDDDSDDITMFDANGDVLSINEDDY